ncbi:MAG: hypothetical protein ABI579_03565 [Candidatus Sumerlaeota bacterium]
MSKPRDAKPWLPPLLLLAFAFVVYGWTLFLPWSFFDDVPYFLIQARETQQHFAAGEWAQAIDSLMRWNENNLGPAVRIYVFIQWLIFGKWSAAWHFVKIITFFFTIWGMRAFVRELKGNTAAQVVAILAFTFFGASSVHPDFQTHFINFARLLTTDSIMTPAAMWAAVVALRMMPNSTSSQRLILALCVGWCTLTKATAIHFTASLMLWFLFNRKWIDALLVLAWSLPGLLFFRVWEGKPVFGYVNLPLPRTPGAVLEIAGQYASICTEALGALWIVALVYTAILALRGRREYFLPLVLFASAYAIQCLWPLVFTRYSIIFLPWLCPLIGFTFSDLSWSKSAGATRPLGIFLTTLLLMTIALPFYAGMQKLLLVISAVTLILLTGVLPIYSAILAAAKDRYVHRLTLLTANVIFAAMMLHAIISFFYTVENARAYFGYERAIWQVAVYTQKLKDENPDEQIIVYTDFVAEHFNRMLNILDTAPSVMLKPFPLGGSRTLAANERLLIWNQDDNFPSFLPQRAAKGYFVQQLDCVEFKSYTCPVRLPDNVIVTHVILNADPCAWPRRVDLEVFLDSEKIGTFRGSNLTRPFMGAQKLILDEPFIASKGLYSLTLKPSRTGEAGMPVLNTKSLVSSQTTISLWGAPEIRKPFTPLNHYVADSATPFIFAPYYIFKSSLFDDRMPKGKVLVGVFGTARHKYTLDLYGPLANNRR